VHLPGVRVRGHAVDLPAGGYRIRLQEIPMAEGVVPAGRVLCAETVARLAGYGVEGTPATLPGDGAPAAWVALADREVCEQAGVVTYDATGAVLLHLAAVLGRYAYEFVGIQETQALLDQFERTHPALVREVTPKLCSPHLVADVLKRLVEEQVSIRDLRTILQALAEWAPVEKDPVVLTEYVRMALKRYITHKYAAGAATLAVYLLDPTIEEAVRGAVQHTASGSYLALEPELSRDILGAVRRAVGELPVGAPAPIILTQMEIRRYVKRLVEIEQPRVAVLSYQELAPELNIQPVGRIRLAA
jgi:type III secretion protein V